MARLEPGLPLSLLLMTVLAAFTARAETTGDADDAPVTRVYRVADLILPAADYTFEGIQMPGLGTQSGLHGTSAWFGNAYSGGGYGGGGAGGAYGGSGLVVGAPPRPEKDTTRRGARTTMRVDWDALIEGITNTVAPSTWEEVGGVGSITPVGKLMVVRQTLSVHKQISDLLTALRAEGDMAKTITVRAYWVLVDSDRLASLRVRENGHTRVNREGLDAIVAGGGSRGEVTCLDGQTVHIISGRIRSSVTSVIPVVGQRSNDTGVDGLALRQRTAAPTSKNHVLPPRAKGARVPVHALAQVDNADLRAPTAASAGNWNANTRQANVGYQPVHKTMNLGALLQVTPTLIPGNRAVVLDVRSFVTRLGGDGELTVPFDDVVPLDRLDVISQQFMTTLWIPLGRPVIVAGSTLEPNARPGTDEQLYLVIEADASGTETR